MPDCLQSGIKEQGKDRGAANSVRCMELWTAILAAAAGVPAVTNSSGAVTTEIKIKMNEVILILLRLFSMSAGRSKWCVLLNDDDNIY